MAQVISLTVQEWNTILEKKEIKDISSELPNSFLMYGQVMKGKIIWKEKKYFVTGWAPPNSKTYIELEEAC